MDIFSTAAWLWDYDKIVVDGKISLNAILPVVGETYPVAFSQLQPAIPGRHHLVWRPPYTNDNGWEDAPSEILFSRIVEGSIESSGATRTDVRVLDVVDLPTMMASVPISKDFVFPEETGADGTLENAWLHCVQILVAWIDPYIYLNASLRGESGLEAILEENDDRLTLLLHSHVLGDMGETALVRYPLSDKEDGVFRKVIEAASVLEVEPSDYLI